MDDKRKYVSKSGNQKHLFLFLYCSVTLILISIFVFMDRDKFSVDGSTHVKTLGGSKDLALLAPEYPLPQCYSKAGVNVSILELTLSVKKLEEFAENIKAGRQEVTQDIEDYLRLRDLCGYISTELKVDLRYSKNIADVEYAKILDSYLEIRKKLKTISPRVNFEIKIENV